MSISCRRATPTVAECSMHLRQNHFYGNTIKPMVMTSSDVRKRALNGLWRRWHTANGVERVQEALAPNQMCALFFFSIQNHNLGTGNSLLTSILRDCNIHTSPCNSGANGTTALLSCYNLPCSFEFYSEPQLVYYSIGLLHISVICIPSSIIAKYVNNPQELNRPSRRCLCNKQIIFIQSRDSWT